MRNWRSSTTPQSLLLPGGALRRVSSRGTAGPILAAYHPSDGSVWVGRNVGSRFAFQRYATVVPASGWRFVAGEFTGDGLADLAAYHPNDGSVWVASTPSPAGPDLIVRRLEVTGSPTLVGNNVQVPVRVVLRNQGTTTARTFMTQMAFTDSRGTFAVRFTVAGQSDTWFPMTPAALAPQAEVTLSGTVTFQSHVRRTTVALAAIADSCG